MLPSLRNRLALSFLLCVAATSLIAQPGTLSSSFGNNGLLTDPSRKVFEKAITTQPDKKVLIGSQGFYQGYQTFMIDRLMPDGNKDSSFSTNGTAYILFQNENSLGNINSGINAIALLPDGKIIAAGRADGSGKHIALARFLSDGTPDASFGTNGASLTSFNSDETVNAIALQADGKIVAGGSTQVSSVPADFRFFVARYLPDGSVDSSFGKSGIAVSASSGSANAISIQPDDKVVAAGYISTMDGNRFHVERYNADGTYDNGFGYRGTVSNGMGSSSFFSILNDITLQADGKILAAGRSDYQCFIMVRYTSTGEPDNSFGEGGIVTTFCSNFSAQARKVMLTPKGDRILLAGTRSDNVGSNFAVAAYTLNGAPDSTFGDDGIVTTDFGGDDIANSAALCADGSLVVLGGNTGRFPFTVRALAKYNGYPATVSLWVKVKRWLQNHTITWNDLPATDKIAYYKVEQSADGKNGFTEIASVSGATGTKEYSTTNSRLLNGANYYRIKAIGVDGSVRYSETVSIDNIASVLSVSPNPAKDVILIKGLAATGTSYISIAGNGGKVMMKAVSSHSTQHRMMISDLQKGMYYLIVTTPDGNIERKTFIKE